MSQSNKSSFADVDYGKRAEDYARYRAGFPAEFFDRIFRIGLVRDGDRVLDLGTGTGTIARGLAQRGCIVTALDVSRPLLEQAKELDRSVGTRITLASGYDVK